MKYSLLRTNEAVDTDAAKRDLLRDLNLDQIIGRICEGWDDEVKRLYQLMPGDSDNSDYRRAAFAEIKEKDLHPVFSAFLENMRQRSLCIERMEAVEVNVQKQVWLLRSAACYIEALEMLLKALSEKDLKSGALTGLTEFLKETTAGRDYISFREETEKLYQELSSFRILLTYEKERFTVAAGSGSGKFDDFLKETFPGQEHRMKSPFLGEPGLSDLEAEIIKQFAKDHKAFFSGIEEYAKKYKDYADAGILGLPAEMSYYVAFLRFMEKTKELGCVFCTPVIKKDRFRVEGLYDLALSLVNSVSGKEVIDNDAEFYEGESFFVLTGPNQGGKTTYARSLGQLVYFTKMGLDVPAKDAVLPYFTDLLTHFSVEESTESGRGKLLDELERLKPMFKEEKDGAFVVINELFTTAANYDACIMGKKVLEFFIGKHCRGIYVTHLNELSESCDGVVSLRAQVDDHMVQTYRIRRDKAQEKTGVNSRVEKYGLTYAKIKERFK